MDSPPFPACSSTRGMLPSWRRCLRCLRASASWAAAPPPPSTLLAASPQRRRPHLQQLQHLLQERRRRRPEGQQQWQPRLQHQQRQQQRRQQQHTGAAQAAVAVAVRVAAPLCCTSTPTRSRRWVGQSLLPPLLPLLFHCVQAPCLMCRRYPAHPLCQFTLPCVPGATCCCQRCCFCLLLPLSRRPPAAMATG